VQTVPNAVNAKMAAMTSRGSANVRLEEKGQSARIIVNGASMDQGVSWTVNARTGDYAMQRRGSAAA
jgi:hypothetical protein